MPSRNPPQPLRPQQPSPPSTKPNLDLTATHLEHLTLRLAQAFHANTLPSSLDLIRSLSARNIQTHCPDAGADEFIPNSDAMPIEEYIGYLQAYSLKFPGWDVVIHPPKAEVEEGCKSAVVWLTLMANSSVVERGGVKTEGVYKMFWRWRKGRGWEEAEGWEWWRYEHLDGVAGYMF
ncbi:hypothetical protein LTR78_009655 [Recurvomyces mirabilis]|uniref:SnoaL-like domain-containing protein n=1 Tax=Recurvomyces mirabilis TaxID=574656 RepID=A0AAE0TP21_9PEZI|nr:hypothetical protein LTR78_009655 [Recurvomyces mirabilis]KAK5150302.1 hypothetical protein LTS14_010279 [Recurvomyces mirabilis]